MNAKPQPPDLQSTVDDVRAACVRVCVYVPRHVHTLVVFVQLTATITRLRGDNANLKEQLAQLAEQFEQTVQANDTFKQEVPRYRPFSLLGWSVLVGGLVGCLWCVMVGQATTAKTEVDRLRQAVAAASGTQSMVRLCCVVV